MSERANVLRLMPAGSYDLIWSSGLFDYLSDRAFVRLARRMLGALRPGGEMVVGNFAPVPSARSYMELVVDWDLNLRTQGDLLRLAAEIGAAPGEAWVGREPAGVNLFLHLRPTKPA